MKRIIPYVLISLAPMVGMAQDDTSEAKDYPPITASRRAAWVVNSTFSPATLIFTGLDSGLGTLRNSPPELGTHWAGYGQRFGLHMADRALSTTIEASVGSLWGEDPRYRRVPEKLFSERVRHVLKMTVVSHHSDGREMPAYARFIAIPSAAFISNAWKPDSQNSAGDALNRVGFSVATHVLGNAYAEFWPDAKARMFHRGPRPSTDPGATGDVR